MEGKGGFLVLIAIVAFLSLTLAMLVGYVFFVDHDEKDEKAMTAEQLKKEQMEKSKRPLDEELAYLPLYEGTSKQYFNLKTTDPDKVSAIQISAQLVYFKKVEGIKKPLEKITFYTSDIKELIGSYFESKTAIEMKAVGAKQKAKEELTKKINTLLLSNEKAKGSIVYSVVFDDWFVQ